MASLMVFCLHYKLSDTLTEAYLGLLSLAILLSLIISAYRCMWSL